MVCDGLTGIENVIASVFPEAVVQLCTVHLTRNILAKIKPKNKKEVAEDLKAVLNPENQKDTQKTGIDRFYNFIEKWMKVYPASSCIQRIKIPFVL